MAKTMKEAALSLIGEYPNVTGVYIAVILNTKGTYDLDVEVGLGTIGYIWFTNATKLASARRTANRLERTLIREGVRVFKTRREWEQFFTG